MNPIRTNKPVFFGDDGEVLKSGQIYIGQPNQWPLSFPKTVTLQDSAGSQFTAAQPLPTNNQGRIEYNGKSVIALVDGDYSILVRDRNGVTVGEGYTPFVANSDTGGGTTEGVTQVGLTLTDIKQFEVTPGDTVRNVGKAATLDGLGADWLVVSNTGGTADDVDLIDFANGTQGERYTVYPQHREATVELGGNFDAGASVKCVRTGSVVTISSVGGALSHVSFSSPGSDTGVIPEWARPVGGDYQNVATSYPAGCTYVIVNTDGRLLTANRDWSGTLTARTETFAGFSITYTV